MTAYCEKLDNCDAILYQRYYAVLFRVLSDWFTYFGIAYLYFREFSYDIVIVINTC